MRGLVVADDTHGRHARESPGPNRPAGGREILTLGEGFNTQVITLWCFYIVAGLAPWVSAGSRLQLHTLCPSIASDGFMFLCRLLCSCSGTQTHRTRTTDSTSHQT